MFPLPKDKSYLKNVAQSRAGVRENFTNEFTLGWCCDVNVCSGWKEGRRWPRVVDELNVLLQGIVQLLTRRGNLENI